MSVQSFASSSEGVTGDRVSVSQTMQDGQVENTVHVGEEDWKSLMEEKLKEVVFVELSEEEVQRAMVECAILDNGREEIHAQVDFWTVLSLFEKFSEFREFLKTVPETFWSMMGGVKVRKEGFFDYLKRLEGRHLSFAVGLFNVCQMLYTGDYSLKSMSIAVVQTISVFAPSLENCFRLAKGVAAGAKAIAAKMRPKEVQAQGLFDVDWVHFFSALLGVEVKETPVDLAVKIGKTWRDVVSFGSMVTFVFGGLYFVVRWAATHAGYGFLFPSATMELDDAVSHYVSDVIEALENRTMVVDWCEQAEFNELSSMIHRGTELVRNANTMRLAVPTVNATLARLMALRTAVLTVRQGTNARDEPVCVVLYGPPGMFKTSFVEFFGNVIGLNKKGNQVYQRPMEAKFWDGYAGQAIALYDDKLSIVENERLNDFYAEFLSLIGTAPMSLNMAAVEEKGTTMFTSKYVFLTTNVDLSKGLPKSALANLADATAVNRRMHVRVRVPRRDVFVLEHVHDFGMGAKEFVDAVGVEFDQVKLGEFLLRYQDAKVHCQRLMVKAREDAVKQCQNVLFAIAESRGTPILAQMDAGIEMKAMASQTTTSSFVVSDDEAEAPLSRSTPKVKEVEEIVQDALNAEVEARGMRLAAEEGRFIADMMADWDEQVPVETRLFEAGVVIADANDYVLGKVVETKGRMSEFVRVVREKFVAKKIAMQTYAGTAYDKLASWGKIVREKIYSMPSWLKTACYTAAVAAAVLAGAAFVLGTLYVGMRADLMMLEANHADGDTPIERPHGLVEGVFGPVKDEFDHDKLVRWYVIEKGVPEQYAKMIVDNISVAPSRVAEPVKAQHYQKAAHLNQRMVPRVDVANRTVSAVTRMPITAQMASSSAAGLADRLRTSLIKVNVKEGGTFTNGFVLIQQDNRIVVVCALHVFSYCLSKGSDGNVRFKETTVTLSTDKGLKVEFETSDFWFKFIDESDLVIFEAPAFKGYQFKNMVGYLRSRKSAIKSTSNWYRVNKKDSTLIGGLAKVKSSVEYDEARTLLRFVVKDCAEVGVSGSAGDCGLPYFDAHLGKITGFHVAGSQHVSVCSQLYLEDVSSGLEAQCDYEDLPKPNVPTRTSIVPNPLGSAIDGKKVQSRDGELEIHCIQHPVLTHKSAWDDVKEKIVDRLKRVPVTYPVAWLEMTRDYVRHFYRFEDRVLTLAEAIRGVPGLLDPMDLDTGMGYPFSLENPKAKYWMNKEDIDESVFVRLVHLMEEISKPDFNPEDWVDVDVIFPKDECLKIGKVPRPVHLMSKVICLAEKMLWGCAYACVKRNCVTGPIAVGINPHGPEWGQLKARFGEKVACADLSEQDVSISAEHGMYFCEAFRQPSTSDLHNLQRRNLMKLIVRLPTYVDGVWLRRVGGNTTGSYVTSLFGSFDTISVYVGAHLEANPSDGLDDILDCLELTVYGDDSIAEDEKIDFSRITEVMAAYGKKVTNASKTGPPSLEDWSKVEYLSRSFVEENGVVYAPLRYHILFDMCYYMRVDTTFVASSIVRSLMYEASHHGKLFYDSLLPIVKQGMMDEWAVDFLFDSYEDMLSLYRDGLVFSIEDDPLYAQAGSKFYTAYSMMYGEPPLRHRIPLERWTKIVAQMDPTPVEGDDPGLPPMADVPIGEVETLRIATVDGQRSYKFWKGIPQPTGKTYQSLDNAQLVKPYLIATIDWSTSEVEGTVLQTFHFPYDLLAIPAVGNRLQHVCLMRADVEVELVLNSNKFVTGALLITCLPCFQPGVPGRHRWITLRSASTSPSVIMSANTTGSVKIEMPYASPWPFVRTEYPGGPEGTIAAMQVAVLSPLDLVQAQGTPRVTVQVFASFKNATFTNPTPLTLVIPSLNTFSVAGYSGLIVERKDGVYSVKAGDKKLADVAHPNPRMWPKGVLAELTRYKLKPQARRKKGGRVVGHITEERLQKSEGFMGAVEAVPVVGPILRKTLDGPISSAFAGLMSSLAFMDKPAMLPDVRHFVVGEQIDQCTGDGVSVARKLTASNAQFVPNDNGMVSESSDAMNIASLVVRPSFFGNFGITAGQIEGQLLFGEPNSLLLPTGNGVCTVLQWLGTMFRFWRGTMRWSFKFHASQFSTARVRFAWFPDAVGAGPLPVTIDIASLSESYSQDVEVKGDTTVVIDVPPSIITSWLAVENGASGFSTGNGYIAVYLSSRLNSFDIAAGGISCSVFVSGCPDFEFAAPNNLAAANHYFAIEPQTSVQELGVMDLNPIAPSDFSLDQTNTFGESVSSLALLCRRFHFLENVNVNPTTGYSYQLYDRLADSAPTSYMSVLLWRILYAFHMGRGGFRFKIVRESVQRGSMIIYNTGILRGVTFDLARYLSSGGAYNLGPEVQEFTVEVPAYAPQLWADLFVAPVADDPMGQHFWPGVGVAVSATETISVYVSVADDFVAGCFGGVPSFIEPAP